MTLKVGDTFPKVQLKYVPYDASNPDACGVPQTLDTVTDFANKKVVIFAVPGAFTPTCSAQHLPGYLAKVGELKAKGVDLIIGTSSNDFFVLDAWGKQQGVTDKILLVSDANGELGRATGLTLDLTSKGLGPGRLTRFAAVVVDGKVTYLEQEPNPGEVSVSGVDAVLAAL